jgi:hypothetical protein
MEDRNQEDLRKLFERFTEPTEAEAAARDIRLADEMLAAHPAPEPRPEVIIGIKLEIATTLATPSARPHRLRRVLTAAAAVVVMAILALIGRAPRTNPQTSYAALIPTAVWESDDISADDMDIAYLASEISRIEDQVRALEAGQTEDIRVATLHEVETALMQINTEFWRE